MTAPTVRGVYRGVPEKVYHGDKPAWTYGEHVGSLSSSAGRRLLELAPAEWRWEQDHPKIRKVTDEMELGTAAHTQILGVGAPWIEVASPDWTKKPDQVLRKQIRARGEVPLLTHQVAQVLAMAKNVHADPDAGPLLATGTPELSAYGRDPETGVMLRARTDWLRETPSGRVAVDVKTAESSDPADFEKEAAKFGYHVQQAWYEHTFALAGVPLSAFLFVVVAKRAPHLVTVCELPARAIDLGRDTARRAIDLYHRCATTETWPGHGHGIHQIDLPAWEYKKEQYRNDQY